MAATPKLEHRTLGKCDLSVSAIGLGCMSLSGVYGAADDAVSEDLIRHAIAFYSVLPYYDIVLSPLGFSTQANAIRTAFGRW